MINIHRAALLALPAQRARHTRAFKLLLYALTSVLALILALTVFSTRLEGRSRVDADLALIQLQVLSYADSWNPEKDMLVAVEGDSMAKRSNVEGLVIDGVRYYYRMPNA